MLNPAHPANSNPMLSTQGTSDAYKNLGFDPGGNNEFWGSLRRFFPGMFEGAASNQQFANTLTPERQQAIRQLIDHLSAASQHAELLGLQRGNTEQASQGARQASLMGRSQGLGDGFQAGTNNAFLGNAQRQNAGLARDYASPEHQTQLLQSILQAIGYGQENPQLNQLAQYGSLIEQRHQQNQSEVGSGSLWSSLAPVLGGAVQTFGGGAFGGSGGGSGAHISPIRPGYGVF